MSLRHRKALAAATAAALLAGLAGCNVGGGGGDEATQPQVPPTASPTPTPTVKADTLTASAQADAFAGLRRSAEHLSDVADRLALGASLPDDAGVAGANPVTFRKSLTHLLTEHVYLVAAAARTALEKSETSPATEQALAALEANSKEFTAAFGGLLEAEQREAFRTGWAAFARSFFAYAVAAKDDDAVARRKAETELDTFRVTAADLLAKASANKMPAYLTKAELKNHIASMRKALDALAADDEGALDLFRAASEDVAKTATALAKSFLRDDADVRQTASPAADVRADLASLSTQHTYLVGLAFSVAYADAKRFTSPAYMAAKATLEDNSKELATIVREVSSSERQVKFLEDWRDLVRDLEDYAEAAAYDNQRAKDMVLESLYGYQRAAGVFFDRMTDRRDAGGFSAGLSRHLRSFTGTIDAIKAVFARGSS